MFLPRTRGPLLAGMLAVALILPAQSAWGTTSTVNGHIYLCQSYTNSKGIVQLTTSTTEVTGGTISVPSASIASQANPVAASTSLASGTYTMTATVPGGYYFTECPNEAATPTLSGGATAASESFTVSSNAGTGSFYVVPFQSATCTGVVGGVQCSLPNTLGLPAFPLATLVAEAQTVSSSVSAADPIVITAYGGNGGSGDKASGSAYSAGSGANGGWAQTATTIAEYETTYQTTVLYYYLGYKGIGSGNYGDVVGGLGGTSTIVSGQSLSTTDPCIQGYGSCSSTNVLLIGGGGGGGGEGGVAQSGGHGGAGGMSAVATTTANVTKSGSTAAAGGGTGGHAGHGGGSGSGGAGGAGGGGTSPKYGTPGNSGIGGTGGPVHTKSGPSKSMPWTNVGYLTTIGTDGSGGEGEWRGTGFEVGGGGGGGGGYGGGGGGGGGGATFSGGGGGGGGSFAKQATTSPGSFTSPSDASGSGQVYVTFLT